MRRTLARRITIPVSTGPWLDTIDAHARATYPEECCGIVTARVGGDGVPVLKIHRCRNIQGAKHETDPIRFPRSARTAYYIDPGDQRQVHQEADATGATIVAIYHSHADSGAYFSDPDRRQAAPDGEPLWPEVSYLVVSIMGGHVRERVLYAWDDELREYVDADLSLRFGGSAPSRWRASAGGDPEQGAG